MESVEKNVTLWKFLGGFLWEIVTWAPFCFSTLQSVTDCSDQRSSRSSSRNGMGMTPPPPPPVRSSSKGVANNYGHSPIPPLPARNYDVDELPPPLYENDVSQPRYAPPPGIGPLPQLFSDRHMSNIVLSWACLLMIVCFCSLFLVVNHWIKCNGTSLEFTPFLINVKHTDIN